MKQEDFSQAYLNEKGRFLESLSPKLHKFVSKKYPAELSNVHSAFFFACQNGGLDEIAFIRTPGSSFNPRAARIPLIIDQFYQPYGIDLCIAGILSTANSQSRTKEKIEQDGGSHFSRNTISLVLEVVELENLLALSPGSLRASSMLLKKFSFEATITSLCLYIDRFRHAHQAEKNEIDACLSLYDNYLSIIPSQTPNMALTFETWHKRSLI